MPNNRAEYQRQWRAGRAAAGTCIECVHPATNGQRCPFCASKNQDRARKSAALAKPPAPESSLRVDELMRRVERSRHA